MSVSNRRVLVTGGAGFIGSHLVDKLVELDWRVTVLDNLSFGCKEQVNKQAEFAGIDVCDYLSLRNVTSDTNPQLIFHLAANATTKESAMGWQEPVADYQVNAIGTLNILRAVAELDIDCHVIYASSAAVYGEPEYTPIDEGHPTNPISPYGISKLAGEKYCLAYFRENQVKTTILRIFNTYGPRQPRYIMFDLVNKLNDDADRLEVLGTGKQVRDYCYVSDTVNAFILAAENNAFGEVYNVAGGNRISIAEVAKMIVESMGLAMKTKIHYSGESWKGDINTLYADISKIKRELGFRPTVLLEEGVSKFVEWFKNGPGLRQD